METKEQQTVDLSQLTDEQLDELLKKREEKKRKDNEKKRIAYETDRDELVNKLVSRAMELNVLMRDFKKDAIERLEAFRERAQEYGEIRSHSKGGFSLRHSEGDIKVSYDRNTKIEYDERADHAAELIKDFLADMVKKRDQDAYEMIMSLLQKNKAGDFKPSLIMALISKRDRFADERWKKAIKLFEECHNTHLVSMSVSFYRKDQSGKDANIPLSLPSVSIE